MYWTVTMTDGRTETREGSEADATRWSSEPGVAHVVLVPDRPDIGDRGGERIADRGPGEGPEPSEGGKGKDKGKHKGHDEP